MVLSRNRKRLSTGRRMRMPTADHPPGKETSPQMRPDTVREMSERCTRCGVCRKNCAFLREYGLPADIAAGYGNNPAVARAAAFACSLCGLCTAVCPEDLDPARMFLDLRRAAFAGGKGDFAAHSRLLNYEKRGTSKRYTWYSLPADCETVFFPGCTLPGARPETTRRLYEQLRADDATVGIVLDCCCKPSHDLGRQEYFEAMFSELRRYLLAAGVRNVLVACTNCFGIFSQYGEGLVVKTVYEYLAARACIPEKQHSGIVTVHDPCVIRMETGIHDAARTLIRSHGLTIREMEHSGKRTVCCGEGGAAGCVAGDLARQWGRLRSREARGDRILTYCAGCAGSLSILTPTDHLLDLLFEPERTLAGKALVSRAPVTYLNRLRLKRRLRKNSSGARTRERTFVLAPQANRKRPWFRLLFLMAVLSAVAGTGLAGISQ